MSFADAMFISAKLFGMSLIIVVFCMAFIKYAAQFLYWLAYKSRVLAIIFAVLLMWLCVSASMYLFAR